MKVLCSALQKRITALSLPSFPTPPRSSTSPSPSSLPFPSPNQAMPICRLDVAIVSMSLLDLGVPSLPPWLVHLMRAIRVIRLFGRIPG